MADCMNCAQPDPCKSCGGCNACACCKCEVEECRPRFVTAKMPICEDDAATYFSTQCCSYPRTRDISLLSAWVRPRGTTEWLLTYPAWDRDDAGRIGFRWDDKLFDLGKPRLEVEFRQSNGLLPPTYKICGVIELYIEDGCPLVLASGVNVPREPIQPPGQAIPGVLPVYDDLLGFSGTLCSILEASATSLLLCAPEQAALCAVLLCRPVQLQISDGVNTEYVEFSGCVAGVINVVRGQNNTIVRRFPVGSTVQFVWTTQNVQNAIAGCP